MSEIPVHSRPRRLADWINPTGARKVHSLIDKVYKRENLEMAVGGAIQPVRACQLGRVNSFAGIPPTVSLCESCIRQNRPCSLSGGRRPARKRASSDPTWIAGRKGN